MRQLLCVCLLPHLLLTPALTLGHSAEHESGCAPHFHTHQLPFTFPQDEDENDHDHDAVPVPDLTASFHEPPVSVDLTTVVQSLNAEPIMAQVLAAEGFIADSPPPRTGPIYLITLALRL